MRCAPHVGQVVRSRPFASVVIGSVRGVDARRRRSFRAACTTSVRVAPRIRLAVEADCVMRANDVLVLTSPSRSSAVRCSFGPIHLRSRRTGAGNSCERQLGPWRRAGRRRSRRCAAAPSRRFCRRPGARAMVDDRLAPPCRRPGGRPCDDTSIDGLHGIRPVVVVGDAAEATPRSPPMTTGTSCA